MSNRDDILVWCDVETLGLRAKSPMLELGFRVVDLDLNLVDKQSWLIWDDFYLNEWDDAPKVVHDMHTKNGLFELAKDLGSKRSHVEKWATQWLKDHDFDGNPMCGSSLSTDKAWLDAQMPDVLDCFHYRIIDCSSLKETCRRYNPRVYEHLPPKKEEHRVDPDLVDSVEEFRHYRDNFLFDGRSEG